MVEHPTSRSLGDVKRQPWVFIRTLAVDEFQEQRQLRMSSTAASAAFWLFLSILPAALVIVNVLGLVVAQEQVARVLARFGDIFPGVVGRVLTERLTEVSAPSPGTGLVDTVLVLISLWTISAGVQEILAGLGRVAQLPHRSFMVRRLVALAVAFAGIVAIGATAITVIILDERVGPVISFIIEIVLTTLLVSMLVSIGFNRRIRLQHVVPSACVAALVLFALARGVGYYVAVAPNMAQIYGAAAATIAVMLATYLGTFAILLCGLSVRLLESYRSGRVANTMQDR